MCSEVVSGVFEANGRSVYAKLLLLAAVGGLNGSDRRYRSAAGMEDHPRIKHSDGDPTEFFS